MTFKEYLLCLVGLETIPEGYLLLAEDLVPAGRGIKYDSYAIQRAMGVPDVHYYVYYMSEGWSITLTPRQYQTPPGLPSWAIDDTTYYWRWRAIRHVARSLWSIDSNNTEKQ
jgi:hypothetical protein